MQVSLIAAVAKNGVIGSDGALPWRLPEDLKRFKALTLGKPVIMGRKTWQSLDPAVRPLPGRINIVLSRDEAFSPEGAYLARSLEDGLDQAAASGASEVMVMGGGLVYRQALAAAQRLYLTEVHDEAAGDTYFPDFDRAKWREVFRDSRRNGAGPDFDFVDLALA